MWAEDYVFEPKIQVSNLAFALKKKEKTKRKNKKKKVLTIFLGQPTPHKCSLYG